MNGRELAEVLLRASSIDIDDAGDVLAKSIKGQGVIGQFRKRLRFWHEGPEQLSPFYREAAGHAPKPRKVKKA